MKNNKGFTLIELLAVIVILAIIITIAVQGTMSISNKMKDKMYDSKLEFILNAAKLYGEDHIDNLSNECIKVKTLVETNYLKKDNKNGNPYIQDPRDKSDKKGLDDMCVYIAKKNNRIAASFEQITGADEGNNANYVQYVDSTTNNCIYDGSTCSVSDTPIEVVYKPDGKTSTSFYVLADDGDTLTLITKNSIRNDALGTIGGTGSLVWSSVYYKVEEETADWNYVNKQSYTIDKAYYIDVTYQQMHQGLYCYYSYLTGKSISSSLANYLKLSRNDVNARLATLEEVAPTSQSSTVCRTNDFKPLVKYEWLSGFGWTSGLFLEDDYGYISMESYETGTYGAWYMDDSYSLSASNVTSSKPIHPVIELNKSQLKK